MNPSEVSLRVLQILLAHIHCTTRHAPWWGYRDEYYLVSAVIEFSPGGKKRPINRSFQIKKGHNDSYFLPTVASREKEGTCKKERGVLESFSEDTNLG